MLSHPRDTKNVGNNIGPFGTPGLLVQASAKVATIMPAINNEGSVGRVEDFTMHVTWAGIPAAGIGFKQVRK